MLVPVGHHYVGEIRVCGRVKVNECPEGIARKWEGVIENADRSLALGLPAGKPWDEQDHRLVDVLMELKALRSEE